MIKLNRIISKGEYTEALPLIKEVEEKLHNSYDLIDFNNQQVLFYNIMYIYFGAGKYREALRYNNKLLNEDFKQTRIDVQIYARFINLIIHFELGNHELIESLIQPYSNYISAKKTPSLFEKNFLDFSAKNFINELSKEEFQRFIDSHQDIDATIEQEYFDFESWLNSKVSNSTFEQLVHNKYLNERETKWN